LSRGSARFITKTERNKKEKMTPSPEEILKAASNPNCLGGRGTGWNRKQLAEWGVPWPPPKGWRTRLEREWKEQNKPDTEFKAWHEMIRRGIQQMYEVTLDT
jgi:hypothetical protein